MLRLQAFARGTLQALLSFLTPTMICHATEIPRAEYLLYGAMENDKPAVSQFAVTVLGPAGEGLVEWQLDIQPTSGAPLAVRGVTERAPMTGTEGLGRWERYLFQDGRGKVTEYRHALTGRPLLPRFDFSQSFIPTCREQVPLREGFATSGQYLGHIAILKQVTRTTRPDDWRVDFDLRLNPEVMIGILWSIKDDGTGLHEDNDYRYLELQEADYHDLIAAGCNYFGNPPAKHRRWLQDRAVFFNLPPAFPEDFYRANYNGVDMLTDEPAIRLGLQGRMVNSLSQPSQAADLLISRLKAMYGRDGTPYDLHNAVKGLTSIGTLDLRVDDVPTWETLYESAFYTMAGGSGGIVHEGRYQQSEFDTQMWSLLGPGLKMTSEEYLRFHYSVMRGAARAFGRDWGTSLYGQSHPDLREPALKVAYDMGARWFWFWSADHNHHLPHAEKLRLMKVLSDYARAHPNRDLGALRRAAGCAIALPWGYVLAWDNLYQLGSLPLDRPNAQGVPYREVVASAVWEGVLRTLRGESFDFTADHPDLKQLGYKQIVRITEAGRVERDPADSPSDDNLKMHVDVQLQELPSPAPPKPGPYVLPCVPCHGKPPKIDADGRDWSEAAWFELPGDRFKASGDWSGPEDLSARAAMSYDQENFYFVAEVVDNVHSQTQEGWRIWDGDCVQIAIDPLNTREVRGYSPDQHEFGFALDGSGHALSWRWFGRYRMPPGPMTDARTAARRDESGHRTIYEAAIPLKGLLPFVPSAGRYVGVCILIADDDGQPVEGSGFHRKAMIETSPGAMTDGKQPALFGSLDCRPPTVDRSELPTVIGTWVSITPGNRVAVYGQDAQWPIRVVSDRTGEIGKLVATITALAPASARTATATARLHTTTGLQQFQAAVRFEAPPGRYQLTLTVRDLKDAVLCEERQIVHIHASRMAAR